MINRFIWKMVIKPICVRVVCDLFGSNITLES